jgi:hypothetical protein
MQSEYSATHFQRFLAHVFCRLLQYRRRRTFPYSEDDWQAVVPGHHSSVSKVKQAPQ